MCLLHILSSLEKSEHLTLTVAHFNHASRYSENRKDATLVSEYARSLKLPFVSKTRQNTAPDEASMRRDRYAFLREVKCDVQAQGIVLAHHRDDQIETFLHRLIRGSGREGLKGMTYKNNDLLRPLLFTPKSTLLEYAKSNNIPFREDASNADPKYLRNRIRQELVPLLIDLNPGVLPTLARNISLLGEEDAFLDNLLKQKGSVVVQKGVILFSRKHFLTLATPLQRRFLKMCIQKMNVEAHSQQFSSSLIEDLRNTLTRSKQKVAFVAFSGLIFKRRGDTVRLFSSEGNQ